MDKEKVSRVGGGADEVDVGEGEAEEVRVGVGEVEEPGEEEEDGVGEVEEPGEGVRVGVGEREEPGEGDEDEDEDKAEDGKATGDEDEDAAGEDEGSTDGVEVDGKKARRGIPKVMRGFTTLPSAPSQSPSRPGRTAPVMKLEGTTWLALEMRMQEGDTPCRRQKE
jgi:hypothetical protein